MTSIEEARQNVINAARMYIDDITTQGGANIHYLRTALAALDEAETPDPWQLLADIDEHGGTWFTEDGSETHIASMKLDDRVEAALDWHKNNQQQNT